MSACMFNEYLTFNRMFIFKTIIRLYNYNLHTAPFLTLHWLIPDKGIYQFMNFVSIMCIPNSINMHMHGLAKLLMRDFTF